jgi:hypothetical protein
MKDLLKELIKSGEITVSLGRISATGGLAILVVFVLVLVVLLR